MFGTLRYFLGETNFCNLLFDEFDLPKMHVFDHELTCSNLYFCHSTVVFYCLGNFKSLNIFLNRDV